MFQSKLNVMPILIFIMAVLFSENILAQKYETGISWISYNEAVALAEEHPQKIMLFMEADWCTLCKKMKKEVFPDPEIQSIMNNNFYPVQINIESRDTIIYDGKKWTKRKLSEEFGLYATPTFIFLDSDQSVIGNKPGYMEKKEFQNLLNFILKERYLESSVEELEQ